MEEEQLRFGKHKPVAAAINRGTSALPAPGSESAGVATAIRPPERAVPDTAEYVRCPAHCHLISGATQDGPKPGVAENKSFISHPVHRRVVGSSPDLGSHSFPYRSRRTFG